MLTPWQCWSCGRKRQVLLLGFFKALVLSTWLSSHLGVCLSWEMQLYQL